MADTQNTNPNPIAASGTSSFEATKQAAMALAAHIGQMAAYQRLASGGLPQGVSFSPNAVATPNPTPMPVPIPQGGMPDTHSQYGSPGMADSAAKTDLTNQVIDMANKYTARKKQEDVLKASKDYELLMNAINFNKTLNPDDPKQKAMIDHNNDVINNFFSDPKRASRLQKVMGFDAYDMKAEAKKQQDPEYQAFQLALKNSNQQTKTTTPVPNSIPGGGEGSMDLTLGGTGAPPAPAGMSAVAAKDAIAGKADTANVNPWAQGLNSAAQKFISQMPVGRGPMQYVPSPEEHAEIFRVANKIAPDANTKTGLIEALSRWQSSDLGHLATTLKDMDTTQIQNKFNDLKDVRDNTTRWNIALLDNQLGQERLQLDKMRLDFDKNKDNADKNWQLMSAMQNHQQNIMDSLDKQTQLYENIVHTKGVDADQKKFAITKLNELHRIQEQEFDKQHSLQQDFQKFAKDKYGIQFSEPNGTNAANAVADFDKKFSGATSSPNGSSGTGATVSNPGSSSYHGSAAWEQRSVLPVPTVPTNFGAGGIYDPSVVK